MKKDYWFIGDEINKPPKCLCGKTMAVINYGYTCQQCEKSLLRLDYYSLGDEL